MEIENYFDSSDTGVQFSRHQSSQFAKSVAGDFNPLHDMDARRFCVPGDLLFAVYLKQHGVFESMSFDFLNMVDADIRLTQVPCGLETLLIDNKEREYLKINATGNQTSDQQFVADLTRAYVEFSGQTFPYLLVDLMKQHKVMINPARPLVIYKRMHIAMQELAAADISLHFSGAELESHGKKATVNLNFGIRDADRSIGTGQKQMVLGGLRAYDEKVMAALVDEYQQIKQKFSHTVLND